MAMIQAKQAAKTYQTKAEEITALQPTDLTIDAGNFIVINGPSGSGKTTLLNLLSGIDQPTKGEIYIDNEQLSQLSDKQRTLLRRNRIGLVFQSFELIPVLTAWENVEYPLLLQNIDKSKRKQQVNQILEQVGLTEIKDHPPAQLSGGQKQRVAIARALVSNPEIVLADEPTGNLDSKTGKQIIALMKELNQKQNVAFVIVTHDLFINEYAQRLLKINDGKLKEVNHHA